MQPLRTYAFAWGKIASDAVYADASHVHHHSSCTMVNPSAAYWMFHVEHTLYIRSAGLHAYYVL
jgi:hypothetical protein